MANVFCKAVCHVPGMETASPFTRFWREPEPIVAAAERANSRAHYGRRTWLKLIGPRARDATGGRGREFC